MQSVQLARAGLCLLALGSASAVPALTSRAANLDVRGRVHTSIVPVGLDVYARFASEVVHARVVGVEQRFPAGSIARTAYTLDVLAAVKGLRAGEIVVEVAGASRPGHALDVVDAPRFALGDEVVLFLWTNPSSAETGILGLSQGAYRVARAADGIARVHGLHARAEPVDRFLSRVGDLAARADRAQGGR
jgi:hypothetical protein